MVSEKELECKEGGRKHGEDSGELLTGWKARIGGGDFCEAACWLEGHGVCRICLRNCLLAGISRSMEKASE